ncbi:cellulose-binding domain-containing protein [Actinoplanes sp. NPDC051861]|uniref:cellulose-binding domain-containing protein n=1 Tax=Actinoplanes sp. NPDC051861 TaxID=3155170 RepID=UPI0034171536
MKRRLVWIGACLMAAFSTVAVLQSAYAATGCRVEYSVTNQWSTGFQGSITVTNLGDPINGWTLTFAFPDANQKVTQGWNAGWSQSGATVTATNAGWNGTLAPSASVNVGFTGTWSGANPSPASFALNGTTCNGTAATPSASPSSPAPTTDPWSPPSDLAGPLDRVWAHQEETYSNLYGFRNYGWDQLVANSGTVNYCVRWDSTAHVTAAQRDAVHATLQRQYQKWMDQMLDNGQGWNGWPYRQVPVKVVGWAVRDRAQLEWTDASVDVYVNNIRENAPQCGEPCGRFFHQDGNYSGCPGGAAHHYDQSLWLTAGFQGGAGGDWGQRIGSEYYMSNLSAENVHILLHEIGHTYGLDDFYDWDPTPGRGFIMKAGSATQITEFDKWMLRDFWRHLKSRYGL